MKIPEKIKIAGYEVKVREVRNLMTDREHLGEYAPRTQEITLEAESTEQQKEETFLHEIIEAVNTIYDLGLNHDTITILGVVLHQVFKDNRLVFFD